MSTDLYVYYFGTGERSTTGPTCNACGVDLGPWGNKKELHIQFHESLKPAPVTPTHNEGVWTVTDSEFQKELATAWHRGQKAAILWQHRSDKGENPPDPKCPYEDSNPHTWDKEATK